MVNIFMKKLSLITWYFFKNLFYNTKIIIKIFKAKLHNDLLQNEINNCGVNCNCDHNYHKNL
jgi:hypothetical protein